MHTTNYITAARRTSRYARNHHRFSPVALRRQGGMGATIILFTIALIVLVGAALAYASRGNPSSMSTQSARVYAGLLLKQTGDFRDAYSRYIFDGKAAGTMTFNATGLPSTDLFYPTGQYGNYQAPPTAAMANAATPQWLYNNNIAVAGVGTATADSVAYVPDVTLAVCQEVNRQMYGVITIDVPSVATISAMTSATTLAVTSGRASGCFVTTDTKYIVYTTLGEA